MVRAVVDLKGQIVTMVDRAYLTQAMPMLVVWGSDDAVIPVKHAENVARIAPGAVVEVLPNSGHFPHKDHPDRFVKIVQEFVGATQPASYHRGRWRQLLRNGPLEPANRAEAGEAPLPPVAQLPHRGAWSSAYSAGLRAPIRFSSAVSVRAVAMMMIRPSATGSRRGP